ncbi:hypothetical protein ACRE_064860 [Hapsidospora chrysogenum ATCC 11550]|uniref:Uncharacterized protein n=1 Tax=Hapsidospora chrysogenum (strain ATCC 11550 / CBS 779.69 / DSM 880 / IAM 14645 / JCM 23072 / IMI 49137) TaxID=857340 RepID=A0A086T0A7_HAPC1|nr:hypothetical protein ACRE_064860 [Hapsidospora chrysogenum ATCC 11550]
MCHYTLIPILCPKCKIITASITERDGPDPYFEELIFPTTTPAACPAGVLTPSQPNWHISELMSIQCDRCTAAHGLVCEQEIGSLLSPSFYLPHDPAPPVASPPGCSRASVSSPPCVDTLPNLNNPPGNNNNDDNNNSFGGMSMPPQPQPPTSHNSSIPLQAATTGNQLISEAPGSSTVNSRSPTSAPVSSNETTSAPPRNPSVSTPVFAASNIGATVTPEAAILPISYTDHPNVVWHEKHRG